ncbi:hypothetical protein G7047_16820 [Diaphorobacter sp. HDW4A]|uniref:hypothetical protein n=1 Tax=Diaphorobacter sp. HDW4A TaxID=2714924 RepID=UPI001409808D|nr:hypothetical protein [Diaphorobacter sp. HDW4A]QIL81386.1 hypothetical protein G7047_16820 [Diaphorobacter sp. HDW4A]
MQELRDFRAAVQALQTQKRSGRSSPNAAMQMPLHERSDVPYAPLSQLTSGGCPSRVTKERREFRRMTSKRVFDYFLRASKK